MKLRKRIPVNLITGFLGTGKTTAVLHLLGQKPAHEKWAVLVNEFGEVGIDGALLAGSGAEIRQIAGGCMCCVGNLPMKVALNNLINRTEPDRLLIEATGLGHPQAVVDTLTHEPYAQLLDIRAVICLVDARKLKEQRYLDHPLFRDQLNIADVIVANKNDLCDAADRQRLKDFLDTLQPPKAARGWVANGELELEWLEGRHGEQRVAVQTSPSLQKLLTNTSLPESESSPTALILQPGEIFTRREQSSDGYYSCGWLFAESIRFDHEALLDVLKSLKVLRLKALIRTNRGTYVVNNEEGTLNTKATSDITNSMIEMIHDAEKDWGVVEGQLVATRF